jgi:hypothetical protein
MLAQRIKTGFRRIGLAIAVVFVVPGVTLILMGIGLGMGLMPAEWRQSEWLGIIGAGSAFLVLAILGYLAAWTLGWIIATFAGDEENSN